MQTNHTLIPTVRDRENERMVIINRDGWLYARVEILDGGEWRAVGPEQAWAAEDGITVRPPAPGLR